MSKTPSKKKACGICGKTAGKNRKLMITECCDNWICDDELKYKESCARAHRRESICGYHHIESHPGKWQDCNQCKEDGVEDEFPINESFYEKPPPKPRSKKPKAATDGPKKSLKRKACGLCGKAGGKLRKTECCDNWVCNDYHKYRLFSYALNSCSRNHDRYSACSYHFIESHPGEWQDCIQCKENVVNDDFPINEAYYERKPRVSKATKVKQMTKKAKLMTTQKEE